MSNVYTRRHLNENLFQGFYDEKTAAWHHAGVDTSKLRQMGQIFDGPVPLEIAERVLGYRPMYGKMYVAVPMVDEAGQPVLDGDGNEVYGMPEPVQGSFTRGVVLDTPNGNETVYVGSDGYRIHSPRGVVLDAVQALTHAGADLATVGKLGNGRLAFTSWRAREGFVEIPGFGGLQAYINSGTSTDGSLASSVSVSTQLVVCDNTALAAERRAGARIYKVKHTSGSVFDLAKAAEVIELAITATQSTADHLCRLMEVNVSGDALPRVLDVLIPVPEGEGRGRTQALNRRQEILAMYVADSRVPMELKGTLAGMWQAFHTQATWGDTVRGNKIDPIGRQWERSLRGESVDDAFWAAVKHLEIAPKSLVTV